MPDARTEPVETFTLPRGPWQVWIGDALVADCDGDKLRWYTRDARIVRKPRRNRDSENPGK